jgi:hypothetical protein
MLGSRPAESAKCRENQKENYKENGMSLNRGSLSVAALMLVIVIVFSAGAQAQQTRQWTPTNMAAIDEKEYFSSLDSCAKAQDVVNYRPSDFTHLQGWKNRIGVELRNLEADWCITTATVQGIQNVRKPKGSPMFYDKVTGKMLADGECGNPVFDNKPVPVQAPPPPPAAVVPLSIPAPVAPPKQAVVQVPALENIQPLPPAPVWQIRPFTVTNITVQEPKKGHGKLIAALVAVGGAVAIGVVYEATHRGHSNTPVTQPSAKPGGQQCTPDPYTGTCH